MTLPAEAETLARRALEIALAAGASYADARFLDLDEEHLAVRNSEVEGWACRPRPAWGAAVRVQRGHQRGAARRAAAIGLDRSEGAMRAQSCAHLPLVRMTNVSLLRGEAGSLEERSDLDPGDVGERAAATCAAGGGGCRAGPPPGRRCRCRRRLHRDGTFPIDGGQRGPAVRSLRHNQSILEALASCDGVGQLLRVAVDGTSQTRAPAVRLGPFRFTSVSDH